MKREAKAAVLSLNDQRTLRIEELSARLKRLEAADAPWQIINGLKMEIAALKNARRNARDQIDIFPRAVMGLSDTVNRLKIFKRRGKKMTDSTR